MKKSHIIGILIIAISLFIIIITAGNTSKYLSFTEAHQQYINGDESPIHVVGKLKKDSTNNKPIGIETSQDHLSCSFLMRDQNNKEERVYYNNPLPIDLTKSENVVVIGNFYKQKFIANKILMKCPSKYQEKNPNQPYELGNTPQ